MFSAQNNSGHKAGTLMCNSMYSKILEISDMIKRNIDSVITIPLESVL